MPVWASGTWKAGAWKGTAWGSPSAPPPSVAGAWFSTAWASGVWKAGAWVGQSSPPPPPVSRAIGGGVVKHRAKFRAKTTRLDNEEEQARLIAPLLSPAPKPKTVALAEPSSTPDERDAAIQSLTILAAQLIAQKEAAEALKADEMQLKLAADAEAAKKRRAADDDFLLMF